MVRLLNIVVCILFVCVCFVSSEGFSWVKLLKYDWREYALETWETTPTIAQVMEAVEATDYAADLFVLHLDDDKKIWWFDSVDVGKTSNKLFDDVPQSKKGYTYWKVSPDDSQSEATGSSGGATN